MVLVGLVDTSGKPLGSISITLKKRQFESLETVSLWFSGSANAVSDLFRGQSLATLISHCLAH